VNDSVSSSGLIGGSFALKKLHVAALEAAAYVGPISLTLRSPGLSRSTGDDFPWLSWLKPPATPRIKSVSAKFDHAPLKTKRQYHGRRLRPPELL